MAMLVAVVFNYLLSGFMGSIVVYFIYSLFNGTNQAQDWMNNSTTAQFLYSSLVYVLFLYGVVWLFKRWWGINRQDAGLVRPKFSDPFRALLALPIYYSAYYVTIMLVNWLFPSFNPEQSQPLGFEKSNNPVELLMIFLSLVIIPPIVEEIVMRGYLYGGLKKKLKTVPAALLTSILFAIGHLQLGGGGKLVWVAAVFTFVLSLFLVYLKEKTGRIWASICLHMMINGISFLFLFVLSNS